nr:NUDIX hydrolase [Sphingomonas sp.]
MAVLPYRVDTASGVSILLITSRGTGRWVVPKGNPIAGLSPHAAAAHEAEEEAGVLGAVSSKPLGSFEYLKVRNDGSSRLAKVSLFPFLVTHELDDWLEAPERERRWFPLDAAAEAVDEDDLAAMIHNFRPENFRTAVNQPETPNCETPAVTSGSVMRWLRAVIAR